MQCQIKFKLIFKQTGDSKYDFYPSVLFSFLFHSLALPFASPPQGHTETIMHALSSRDNIELAVNWNCIFGLWEKNQSIWRKHTCTVQRQQPRVEPVTLIWADSPNHFLVILFKIYIWGCRILLNKHVCLLLFSVRVVGVVVRVLFSLRLVLLGIFSLLSFYTAPGEQLSECCRPSTAQMKWSETGSSLLIVLKLFTKAVCEPIRIFVWRTTQTVGMWRCLCLKLSLSRVYKIYGMFKTWSRSRCAAWTQIKYKKIGCTVKLVPLHSGLVFLNDDRATSKPRSVASDYLQTQLETNSHTQRKHSDSLVHLFCPRANRQLNCRGRTQELMYYVMR